MFSVKFPVSQRRLGAISPKLLFDESTDTNRSLSSECSRNQSLDRTKQKTHTQMQTFPHTHKIYSKFYNKHQYAYRLDSVLSLLYLVSIHLSLYTIQNHLIFDALKANCKHESTPYLDIHSIKDSSTSFLF